MGLVHITVTGRLYCDAHVYKRDDCPVGSFDDGTSGYVYPDEASKIWGYPHAWRDYWPPSYNGSHAWEAHKAARRCARALRKKGYTRRNGWTLDVREM